MNNTLLRTIFETKEPFVVGCSCGTWIRWWLRGNFGLVLVADQDKTVEAIQKIQTEGGGNFEIPLSEDPKHMHFFINSKGAENQIVVFGPGSPPNIERSFLKIEFCPFCGSSLNPNDVFKIKPSKMDFKGSRDGMI